MITLEKCNPFVRAAEIQPAVLEGFGSRIAYDYRLFYILQGNGYFITDGEEYPISPDTLICFPGGLGYCFRGKMRVVVINFDMTRASDDRPQAICPPPAAQFRSELRFDTTVALGFDQLIIMPGSHQLSQSLVEIAREFHTRNPLSDPICSGMLKHVLGMILKQRDIAKDAKTLLTERIQSYIALHAHTLKNNGQLAREFGYHPVYLASIFEEKTGQTLHQAIVKARLARACRYLTQTQDNIESIALENGFSSRSHFCTLFKKEYGISPMKYRAQNS